MSKPIPETEMSNRFIIGGALKLTAARRGRRRALLWHRVDCMHDAAEPLLFEPNLVSPLGLVISRFTVPGSGSI